MKIEEVHQLLDENKNERGIEHWKKMNIPLQSYGIGLTVLKKIAKQIGKNHELAIQLWKDDCFESKQLSMLIDVPKEVDEHQVESMIEKVGNWMLSHIFVQNLFSKLKFAKPLAEKWRESENEIRRRCGFAYLYYLAKDMKNTEDAYFHPILDRIEAELQGEENFVKDAMNNALLNIGQRSEQLNERCIEVAQNIGEIEVDYGDNSCEPANVIKHLTGDRIQSKFR